MLSTISSKLIHILQSKEKQNPRKEDDENYPPCLYCHSQSDPVPENPQASSSSSRLWVWIWLQSSFIRQEQSESKSVSICIKMGLLQWLMEIGKMIKNLKCRTRKQHPQSFRLIGRPVLQYSMILTSLTTEPSAGKEFKYRVFKKSCRKRIVKKIWVQMSF